MAILFDVAVALLGTIGLASVATRFLGIRRTRFRRLLAGFIGLAAGSVTAWKLSPGQPSAPPQMPVMAVSTILAAMLSLAVLEALFPGKRYEDGRLPTLWIPHPIRSLRRRAATAARCIHVLSIGARYGFSSRLWAGRSRVAADSRTMVALNLRHALEDAGGMFVKLGQFLSTRPDILPAAVTSELSRLQDGAPPVPLDQVLEVINEELGGRAEEYFSTFDPTPLGSASIAQVHRATLTSGEAVAVKVQRPDVHILVARDLAILQSITRLLERRSSWVRDFRVAELADGFAQSLREELDFRVEAGNIQTVVAGLRASGRLVIPALQPTLVTRRVLATTWLDGTKLRDAQPAMTALGLDRRSLARSLLWAMVDQIIDEGVFHADPHPGNVLLLHDGRLALVDFGSVGRLDPLEVEAFQMVLVGVMHRDSELLHEALRAITYSDGEVDEQLIERDLARLIAERFSRGASVDAAFFTALFRLVHRNRLGFPPEVAAVFRCLVTLEGTLRLIDPSLNMIEEVRERPNGRFAGIRSRPPVQGPREHAFDASLLRLRRLPRRLDSIASTLDRGQFTLNARLRLGQGEARWLERIIDRIALVIFGPAVGVMSVLLLGTHGGPRLGNSADLNQILGYAGICISIALILRALVAVGRARST